MYHEIERNMTYISFHFIHLNAAHLSNNPYLSLIRYILMHGPS